MSETTPSDDFLDDAAPAESAAAAEPNVDESRITPEEKEAPASPPQTAQDVIEAARERAEELRSSLTEVRRIQEEMNAELRELEKLLTKYEAPPPLHEQNRYAQKIDQPNVEARAQNASILAGIAQRLQRKYHPPVFPVKLGK